MTCESALDVRAPRLTPKKSVFAATNDTTGRFLKTWSRTDSTEIAAFAVRNSNPCFTAIFITITKKLFDK